MRLSRVYQKHVPNTNSLPKLDSWKIADTNSNQRLISLSQSISQSILFSYVQFCKQGAQNAYFEVACVLKCKTKNDFFCVAGKYGLLLLICKYFRKK